MSDHGTGQAPGGADAQAQGPGGGQPPAPGQAGQTPGSGTPGQQTAWGGGQAQGGGPAGQQAQWGQTQAQGTAQPAQQAQWGQAQVQGGGPAAQQAQWGYGQGQQYPGYPGAQGQPGMAAGYGPAPIHAYGAYPYGYPYGYPTQAQPGYAHPAAPQGPGFPGHRPGAEVGMTQLMEEIAGGGNGLSSLGRMLNLNDKELWKGALIGAAAVLLLTNESVQNALFKTGVRASDAVRSGVDKVKARAQAAAGDRQEGDDRE